MRAAVAVIALYHILGRQPATAPRCDPKPKLIILTDWCSKGDLSLFNNNKLNIKK